MIINHRCARDTVLQQFVNGIEEISSNHAVVFTIHPRTLSRIKDAGLFDLLEDHGALAWPAAVEAEPEEPAVVIEAVGTGDSEDSDSD